MQGGRGARTWGLTSESLAVSELEASPCPPHTPPPQEGAPGSAACNHTLASFPSPKGPACAPVRSARCLRLCGP